MPAVGRFYREPASNGNSSTIATVREQCQTQLWRVLHGGFSVTVHERATICYPAFAMDYLWTPWRYAYVSSSEKAAGCVFCDAVKQEDAKALIVYRGEHCFVILNAYPYTPGHV